MDEVEYNCRYKVLKMVPPPGSTTYLAQPFTHKQYPVLRNYAFGKQGKQTSTTVLKPTGHIAPAELEEDVPQIHFIAKPYHAKSMQYAPHRLRCGVMNYAWGHYHAESAVAQWKARGDPDFVAENVPYAELWVGTHISAPSFTLGGEPLSDFLTRHLHLLGTTHIEQFGPDLPYLLKILSVRTALSIQAHPEKSHAELLHRTDPKHYPDPNHKPEAVVALTSFKAMCSFRPLREIAMHLKSVPELEDLVDAKAVETLLNVVEDPNSSDDARKAALKAVYVQLLNCDGERTERQIQALTNRLRAKSPDLTATESTFLDLVEQYPGDSGCFHVFFLNIINLNPGEGLFLAANEPHAYVRGDAVEVMACSDNVVRAGLTPKFKDVRVLGEMLSYDTQEVHIFRPNLEGPFTFYCPPPEYPDFKLLRIHLTDAPGKEWTCTSYELSDSSACLLCVKGTAEVIYCVRQCANPPQRIEVGVGAAYFLPANVILYFSMLTEFVAFVAEAQL